MNATRPDIAALRSRILSRVSLIEASGRERARHLLDPGSYRELLGPFDRLESPWLPMQGIVPQADDGLVVARGTVQGNPALVLSFESEFQGGSVGEVSGSKVAAALEHALRDCEQGQPILPVLVLETGGVRLQEANLGLATIAEIHAMIIALRAHVPVIGVVTGMVGCFGGMSIAAALCSHLIMLPQGRLGLNGPEVIEQEAGLAELDAHDKALIWSLIGGRQRQAMGLVDALVEDDAQAVRHCLADWARQARHTESDPRLEPASALGLLAQLDPVQPLEADFVAAARRHALAQQQESGHDGI